MTHGPPLCFFAFSFHAGPILAAILCLPLYAHYLCTVCGVTGAIYLFPFFPCSYPTPLWQERPFGVHDDLHAIRTHFASSERSSKGKKGGRHAWLEEVSVFPSPFLFSPVANTVAVLLLASNGTHYPCAGRHT